METIESIVWLSSQRVENTSRVGSPGLKRGVAAGVDRWPCRGCGTRRVSEEPVRRGVTAAKLTSTTTTTITTTIAATARRRAGNVGCLCLCRKVAWVGWWAKS
jgi:hypothetical protein